MITTSITRKDILISEGVYRDELLTVAPSGTAGSITDTTSYPVTDQSTKTEKITVDGGTEQTVTFPASTTTALLVAAAINGQISGVKATVVGGQVVLTSDNTGAGSSIAIGTGTCDLTWDDAVAGTGVSGTLARGTLLARNSSTSKMVPYVSGGSTGIGTPVALLMEEYTWTASGDKKVQCLVSGTVVQENLVAHDVGAITAAEAQSMMSNSNITAVKSVATGA